MACPELFISGRNAVPLSGHPGAIVRRDKNQIVMMIKLL